jgi:hypothetical protein
MLKSRLSDILWKQTAPEDNKYQSSPKIKIIIHRADAEKGGEVGRKRFE